MFVLGGALLLYALMLSSGNYALVAKNWATDPKDKKDYTRRFGAIIAMIGGSMAISGVLALFVRTGFAVIALVLLLAAAVFAARRIMKDHI